MPPPTTSVAGLTLTYIGSSGCWCLTRSAAAETRALAFSVAAALSVLTHETCSRTLVIWQQVGIQAGVLAGPAEGLLVQVRRAGGHDDAGQAFLLDVLLDHLLAERGAHELVVARDGDVLDVLAGPAWRPLRRRPCRRCCCRSDKRKCRLSRPWQFSR